jgi:glycosyltransferase involved in cell wall biosynthesis
LEKHKGKEVILSFGDLEPRKGIDLLLRLTAENEDLVLVRCGRTKQGYTPNWTAILSKEKLIRQGRIFELDSYVEDQGLFDALYGSIRCFVLSYKNFYRTSSVMLQALHYTKPVLVPDVGLLRDRVERNGLGRTFRNLSYRSMCEEFQKLRVEYDAYDDNIRRYIRENFTGECYERIFEKTLIPDSDEEPAMFRLMEACESAESAGAGFSV